MGGSKEVKDYSCVIGCVEVGLDRSWQMVRRDQVEVVEGKFNLGKWHWVVNSFLNF